MGGGTALHRHSGTQAPSVASQFQKPQSPPLDKGRWKMKDHEWENMEITRKSEKCNLAVCSGRK